MKKFLLLIAAVVLWYFYTYTAFLSAILHEPGHYLVGLLTGANPEYTALNSVTFDHNSYTQLFFGALAGPMWGVMMGVLLNKFASPLGWAILISELDYAIFIGGGDYAIMEDAFAYGFGEAIVIITIGVYGWKRFQRKLKSIEANSKQQSQSTKQAWKKPISFAGLSEADYSLDGITRQRQKTTTTTARRAI